MGGAQRLAAFVVALAVAAPTIVGCAAAPISAPAPGMTHHQHQAVQLHGVIWWVGYTWPPAGGHWPRFAQANARQGCFINDGPVLSQIVIMGSRGQTLAAGTIDQHSLFARPSTALQARQPHPQYDCLYRWSAPDVPAQPAYTLKWRGTSLVINAGQADMPIPLSANRS